MKHKKFSEVHMYAINCHDTCAKIDSPFRCHPQVLEFLNRYNISAHGLRVRLIAHELLPHYTAAPKVLHVQNYESQNRYYISAHTLSMANWPKRTGKKTAMEVLIVENVQRHFNWSRSECVCVCVRDYVGT